MPPKTKEKTPDAATVTPLTDEEVMDTLIYKLLAQFSTAKGISARVGKALWPQFDNLPDTIFGVIDQWVNKSKMTLRITWTEADGSTRYDVEDLHILCLPLHTFELLKGPRGEALLLRGETAREYEAAQPKETVCIKYLDGIIEKFQVWTVQPDPECISIDARKEPRTKPKLARRREDIDTPFKAWYNAAASHEMFDDMETFFNQRLDGRTHPTRKTSRGEVVRFCCYMGGLACNPGVPLTQMWKVVKGAKDIFEPTAMGKYGIGVKRFKTLKQLAGQLYPLNEVGLDPSNHWRYCDMPVIKYNKHMLAVFEPGWNVGPDESMSAYTGHEGDKPEDIPHAMFVERKPEPLGAELEDCADAQCGCIFGIEINEGATEMAKKLYVNEYGATAACSLRLSKNLHNTNRAWGGDSWFIGVHEVEVGLSFGLYFYGDVKTHTARYPTEELISRVGPNSGDWAVMTTTVAGGHNIFAVGHRRGGTVHTYLSSHGLTLTGLFRICFLFRQNLLTPPCVVYR